MIVIFELQGPQRQDICGEVESSEPRAAGNSRHETHQVLDANRWRFYF